MSENQKTIRAFIDAFNTNDLEAVLAYFDEAAVYHNIPVAPVTGTEAIRGVLQGFMGMSKEIDWVLHEIAESESGAVLTERTDRFLIAEKWVELRVMGSFVLRGDKITEWRDYFDMAQFQSQLAG